MKAKFKGNNEMNSSNRTDIEDERESVHRPVCVCVCMCV